MNLEDWPVPPTVQPLHKPIVTLAALYDVLLYAIRRLCRRGDMGMPIMVRGFINSIYKQGCQGKGLVLTQCVVRKKPDGESLSGADFDAKPTCKHPTPNRTPAVVLDRILRPSFTS